MTIDQILTRLKEGNKRFVEDKTNDLLRDNSRRGVLTSGQEPFAIVLSCADSRVVPELAFDTGLGELFTVRVAGNIANTDSIASIEYAVAHLKTKVIVVLGHESCGAVAATIAGGDNGYNLNHLTSQITPALCSGSTDDVNEVVKRNATHASQELINRSSIISEAVKNNNLKVLPAYYSLNDGSVSFLG